MAAVAPVPIVDPHAVWEAPQADVADPLLWNIACPVMVAHQPDRHGDCVHCLDVWPCPPHQMAQRAMVASRASRQAAHIRLADLLSTCTGSPWGGLRPTGRADRSVPPLMVMAATPVSAG